MDQILIIKNGRIIDPANNRDEVADLFVKNGKITDSLSQDEISSAKSYDASNLVVSPGFIDPHVHFRFPGQTHKENIESGSHCAAAGGFTTVVCMPNTSPAADNPGTIQLIKDAIQRESVVNVLTTGTLTKNREGKQLAPIGSLHKAGVIAVTDDGDCVQNNEIMRRACEYAHMFNLPVMDHCQDASLTQDAVMNEGEMSTKLGLTGWPNAAEDIIVNRNIILSHYTGAHIHMQHLTSAYSVDVLRRAKQRKINVTAEVTPHHIALTDQSIEGYNTNFKMNPPLRTEEDRQALIQGLLDGTIDFIATDHAPHTDYEKDVEFAHAPFGILGLETSLPISLQTLYHSKLCDLSTLISFLTNKPAKAFNINKGTLSNNADADITLFDPNESFTYSSSLSRSVNSPWLGQTLTGKVKATFVAGQQVYDGQHILSLSKV